MIGPDDRIVIGAPCGLTFWTFNVIKVLAVRNRTGKIPVEVIPRLGKVPDTARQGQSRILLFNCPTSELLDALEQQTLPVIYVEEQPDTVLRYLVAANNSAPLEAARIASASYVGRFVLPRVTNLSILRREAGQPIRDYVALLCRLLSVELDEAHAKAMLANLGRATSDATLGQAIVATLPHAHDRPLADPQSEAHLQSLAARVLRPVATGLLDPRPWPLFWPGDIFYKFDPAKPKERATTPIDLAGPARILIDGPLFHLPRWHYEVEFVIAFDGIDGDSVFRIDTFAGKERLARARFRPPASGAYAGSFPLTIHDVGPQLQVQTIIERGAIEGRISLVRVAFSPQPDRRAGGALSLVPTGRREAT